MAVSKSKYNTYRVDVYHMGGMHRVGQFKTKEIADKIFDFCTKNKGYAKEEFEILIQKIRTKFGEKSDVKQEVPNVVSTTQPIKQLGRSWDNINMGEPFIVSTDSSLYD